MDGFNRTPIVKIIIGADFTKCAHKANNGITDTYFAIHRPQPLFHADMFRLLNDRDLIAEKL